jgi:hypothetical protein
MSQAAEKKDTVEVPIEMLETLKRLLPAVEQLVQDNRRERTRAEDAARRAARKAGPTTPEAEARVERALKRIRGQQ